MNVLEEGNYINILDLLVSSVDIQILMREALERD